MANLKIEPVKNEQGIKELIARPTHWFVKSVLELEAFLDDEDAEGFVHSAIAKPAYQCTHAVIIITPSFRNRKYPVLELNTFMERTVDPNDPFEPTIIFWNIEDEAIREFAPVLNQYIFKKSSRDQTTVGDFLVSRLWPYLTKRLRGLGNEMTRQQLEGKLAEYVREHENCCPPVPSCIRDHVGYY